MNPTRRTDDPYPDVDRVIVTLEVDLWNRDGIPQLLRQVYRLANVRTVEVISEDDLR